MGAAETTNPPTFETVWALMQDNAKQMKEFRDSQKEFRDSQKEIQKSQNESMDYLNRKLGSLTNLFGDFTLGMIAPRLRKKFAEFGYIFSKSTKEVEINDRINNISLEIDIMLENGDKAMLVEVKTKLTEERINKHITRLEKMRKYADLRGDKRIFLGAVAGFAVTDEVRKISLKEGFYLIEPDGENFNIIPPTDKPKEW